MSNLYTSDYLTKKKTILQSKIEKLSNLQLKALILLLVQMKLIQTSNKQKVQVTQKALQNTLSK